MAEANEIRAVVEKIGTDRGAWDDNRINEDLDNGLSANAIALAYWERSAATTYQLVSVQESGSSRNLESIHRNAMSMVDMYRRLVDDESTTPQEVEERFPYGPGIRTFPIRRIAQG